MNQTFNALYNLSSFLLALYHNANTGFYSLFTLYSVGEKHFFIFIFILKADRHNSIDLLYARSHLMLILKW